MLTILYQAIVQPLVYVTELVYMLLDWIFKGNTGIAITGVSVIVSLFSLPLYIKAEETHQEKLLW
jgi:membrane protein insertase Oxa1/YidC/SpoIIIJ